MQDSLRSYLLPVLSAASGREEKLGVSAATMEFLTSGCALLSGAMGNVEEGLCSAVAKGWCECFCLLSDATKK